MARLYTWYVVSQSNTPNSGGDWRYFYDVTSTQNYATNQSTVFVDAYIQIKAPVSGGLASNIQTRAIIDGVTLTRTDAKVIGTTVDKTIYLGQLSRTLNHNSDGTRSFYVKCGGRLPDSWQNVYEETNNTLITLPTIPRGSSFASPANYFGYTIGDNLYVGVNKYYSGYSDTLLVKLNGTTIKTIYDFTSQTITFSAGEISAMYATTPNSNSTGMTIELYTYSGATLIGSDNRFGTAYVTNANPTFSTYTNADTDSSMIALTGNNQKYVTGYSDLQFTIISANKAVAQKGATMVSYILKCGTKQTTVAYSAGSTVTGTLTDITASTAEVFAVDSRGNQTAVNRALTMVNYTNPVTTSLVTSRTSYVNDETELVASGTWVSVNFGAQTNSLTATYKYKETSSATWIDGTTTLTITPSGNTWSINQTIVGDIAGGFDPEKSYNVRLLVGDEIAYYQLDSEVSKGTPILHIDPAGVGINQIYETSIGGGLQVRGAAVLNTDDIINNLTSTSTTDALSAAQGKAVYDIMKNVLSSGFGNSDGVTTSWKTLNTIVIPKTGVYLCLLKCYTSNANPGYYLEHALFRNGSSISSMASNTQNQISNHTFFEIASFTLNDTITQQIKTSSGTIPSGGYLSGNLKLIQLS